jgi:hypothetical protein
MDAPVKIGDRVQMRKPHPCGSDMWVIYRVGADIGIRCLGCEHRVLLARSVFFKRLKMVFPMQTIEENKGGTIR